jgi:hypothetical protein
LVLFVMILLLSLLLAIPGQSPLALGIEVVTLAIFTGVGLHLLDRRAGGSRSQQRIGRALGIISPNTVTTTLLLVSGLLLAFGLNAGRYVMVVPVIAAFAGGIVSAWLFMTRIEDRPRSHS